MQNSLYGIEKFLAKAGKETKEGGIGMKRTTVFLIFLSSFLIFSISANLFYQMGIYVDEHNTTPSVVYGGDFWLMASWLRLALSGIMTVISGIALFRTGKK